MRILERCLGRSAKGGSVGGMALQRSLRFERTPRLGSDTSEGDAHMLNLSAVHLDYDGCGCQCELIGSAVAELQIERTGSGRWSGKRDARDDISGLKHRLAMGSRAGEEIEVMDGDAALTLGSLDLNRGLKRGEGNVLVGGVGGDAVLAGAEDGERAIVTADRRASTPGFTLVTGVSGIAEVNAAGSLQKVAASGGHVTQLRRGAGEEGLREHGIVPLDGGVKSNVGVTGKRADDESAGWSGFDFVEGKAVDVDDLPGPLDIKFHEVDERGAAGDEADFSTLLGGGGFAPRLNSLVDGGSAVELECIHGNLLPCLWLGLFTRVLYRRDDVRVSATATDVAVHRLLDVVIGRPDGLLEECNGGHDLAGGTVTALVTVVLDEGCLHGMKVVGLADAFDGCDLFIGMHHGEGEAGVHAAAVDMDGAGSALTVVAALLCAGEIEVLAEAVEEGGAGVDLEAMVFPVDAERDGRCTFCGGARFLCRGSRGRRRGGEKRRCRGGDAGSSQVRQEGSPADATEDRLAGLGGLR